MRMSTVCVCVCVNEYLYFSQTFSFDIAMRDDFVRRELFTARHKKTGNALDGGAFLAAYLVRKQLVGRGEWGSSTPRGDEDERLLMEFLGTLPSYQDYEKYHPILWTENELETYFGRITLSFNLIMGYKNMMVSEYNSFCEVSEEFNQHASIQEYFTMRLSVISRSFGPGPPDQEEELVGVHGTINLEEELNLYKNEAGVDFTKGCRAMSPILDMW